MHRRASRTWPDLANCGSESPNRRGSLSQKLPCIFVFLPGLSRTSELNNTSIARGILVDETRYLDRWHDEDFRQNRWIAYFPTESDENYEVLFSSLLQIVDWPIRRSSQPLDVNRDKVTGISRNDDIDRFLIAECQRGRQANSM